VPEPVGQRLSNPKKFLVKIYALVRY
jgi:hypothetical protein